jgi:hypothetical protein
MSKAMLSAPPEIAHVTADPAGGNAQRARRTAARSDAEGEAESIKPYLWVSDFFQAGQVIG